MQTELDIHRLSVRGSHVLVKRGPVPTMKGKLHLPSTVHDRNKLEGELYKGVVISVGPQTKAARFGRDAGYYEPGDTVHFFNLWDWKDTEVVLKDEKTGDVYLVVDESDIKAYEAAL